MDSLMAVEIKQALERDYDTILTAQEIRALTIKSISGLTATGKLDRNIAMVGSETGNVAIAKIELNTSDQLFEVLNDSMGSRLFVFPPIEGDFRLMKPILQNLKKQVIAVNWTKEMDKFDDIKSLAIYYAKCLHEYNTDGQSIDLMGYSFGSLVAFETAV